MGGGASLELQARTCITTHPIHMFSSCFLSSSFHFFFGGEGEAVPIPELCRPDPQNNNYMPSIGMSLMNAVCTELSPAISHFDNPVKMRPTLTF